MLDNRFVACIEENLVKQIITLTEMGHLPNLSYTIICCAEYLKYNIYLQNLLTKSTYKISNQSLLKYLSFCTLLFLYPAILETYQNNGNNITLSTMSSYKCIARLIAPLVSSNSSYAHICILQQSIHISLLPDHLNVICWQGNIFFLKI